MKGWAWLSIWWFLNAINLSWSWITFPSIWELRALLLIDECSQNHWSYLCCDDNNKIYSVTPFVFSVLSTGTSGDGVVTLRGSNRLPSRLSKTLCDFLWTNLSWFRCCCFSPASFPSQRMRIIWVVWVLLQTVVWNQPRMGYSEISAVINDWLGVHSISLEEVSMRPLLRKTGLNSILLDNRVINT